MASQFQSRQTLSSSPQVGADIVFACLLLAVWLIYYFNNSVAYFTTFNEGIFDFDWRPVGRDFVNYWTGGTAVFAGKISTLFDVTLYHPYQEQLLGHEFAEHNWSYPPHMLLLVWPLGQMPYLWALAAWSLVTIAFYLWSAAAGRDKPFVLILVLLLAPATYENLDAGQNGFLTAALLIGGFRLLGTRPILAGILFGLLTVKPQLGLLVPVALLAGRHWAAIFAACATTAVLIGLSILLFGWESWQAYFDLVVPLQTAIMNERQGVFTDMMPSAYMALRLLGADYAARWGVQAICAAIAVIGVAWTFIRSKDDDLKLSALAVGTFLTSPYAFNYDMTTVSLAVALAALYGFRQGFLPGERLALLLTWSLPTAVQWVNVIGIPIAPLILMTFFCYVLARVRSAQVSAAGNAARLQRPSEVPAVI